MPGSAASRPRGAKAARAGGRGPAEGRTSAPVERVVSSPALALARVASLLLGNVEADVRLMLADPDKWVPDELGPLLGRMVAPALDVRAEEFPQTERS